MDVATERCAFLILGGGMVAGYAAKKFAADGIQPGEVAIISADAALPYERPPLSKGFLAGKENEDSVLINPESFYREHGIDVRLNTVVEKLDTQARTLRLKPGGEIGFEKLLIATGARVKTLDCPGSTLPGVMYLRSLDDARKLRDAIGAAARVVVIGSGFIGMETASQCAQKGTATTMVFPDDRIWQKVFTAEVSAFFRQYYEERRVSFEPSSRVVSVNGKHRVESVTLDSAKDIDADLVIAGIGVAPEIGLLENSGLKLDNGIVVNEYLETSVTGIMAAGDAANYQDVLFGKQRRVEHWDNAVKQGEYAAVRLKGSPEPFVNVPYFFSDVFDLSYEFWGDPAGADQVVYRGNVAGSGFSAWWLAGQRLLAAFVMNRPDEERELAPEWIKTRRAVLAKTLSENGKSLSAM